MFVLPQERVLADEKCTMSHMNELRTITTAVSRLVMDMLVFPIIKALYYSDGSEKHKLIGTGFFIDSDRRFLSAGHVFEGRESASDLEGATGIAVYCVHSVHQLSLM
jgi:hypothetical protein